MQFTNLPSHKATPLLVLLACYMGVVCAGTIPTNYHRHNDPRSHSELDRTTATSGHEVEVGKSQPSQQRTLLVEGKRTHEVPAEVSDWFQDNGTVVQQRVVRQAATGTMCEIERHVVVLDQGTCIQVGSMSACSTSTHLDLNNAACSPSR